MLNARDTEKKLFLRMFRVCMVDFIRKSSTKSVIIQKASDNITVEFHFVEKNDVQTVRKFDDDLLFAYSIAIEAIKDETEKNSKWHLQINENDAVLKIDED